MACCLLLTMFVGGLLDRSAVTSTAGRWITDRPVTISNPRRDALAEVLGRRWRLWLVGFAAAEVAASWLLVTSLIRISRHSNQLSTSVMSMATSGSGGSGTTQALGLIAALVALAITSLLLRASLASHRHEAAESRWWLSPRACVYTSVLAYAVAVVDPVRAAAQHSHLILMAQTMVLIATAPALLMSAIARSLPARVRISGGCLLPAVAAIVFVAVLYMWHLPFAHDAAMANPGLDFLRVASSVAAGLLVWGMVLSDRRRASSRLLAVLIVSIPSGLLGIGLFLSPQPLFQMTGTLPLGLTSLTDQRLSGALMMATDALILLPVLSRLLAQTSPVRGGLPTHFLASK